MSEWCSTFLSAIFVCVQSLLASIICSAVLGLVTGPALGYRRYVGAVYRLTPLSWCAIDGFGSTAGAIFLVLLLVLALPL